MAARVAAEMGYTNVKVFHAGAPAWQKEGKPLLAAPEFVTPRLENVVLIDTRGPEEAQKGHIPGAFAIPLDKVVEARDKFPLDTAVPVILYGADTDLEKIAPVVSELAAWVDNNILVLEGGLNGWKTKGGAVSAEKVRTEIVYLPRPVPGEIVGDEFMNIVKGEPEDKVVLDVRTVEEAAAGKISWSVNIPVGDLEGRLAELPKDKEIIVHCASGSRASMGFNILKDAGFKTRFLNNSFAFLEGKPICCFKE